MTKRAEIERHDEEVVLSGAGGFLLALRDEQPPIQGSARMDQNQSHFAEGSACSFADERIFIKN